MLKTISNTMVRRSARGAARAMLLGGAMLCFALTATARADEATLDQGLATYKSFAVEHIGIALKGAEALQAAVKSSDVKAAQTAWIKSRKGWEAIEPITGEFFPKLDEAIDAWPDAKHGYHAIEAALFAGKLDGLGKPVDELVANLGEFQKQLTAASYKFTPQGLLDGATGLAYEVGENKAKGGESPYAGTSLIDMRENIEGIEAVYKFVLEPGLKEKDAKLDTQIDHKIDAVEDLLEAKDLKSLDQNKLTETGEELAALLQSASGPLGLKKPALED